MMQQTRKVGFSATVGNPPFAGKNTLLAAEGERYLDWLKAIHEESHGNSDIVAHFYRRAFMLLRSNGTFGLLATNTIAQGDTRGTGLRWICKHEGVIYEARRRFEWPGLAAVVVSIVHVQRQPRGQVVPQLDGKPVARISAFLFHQGGDEDPVVLAENANKSFQGSIVLGMGFTFDDTNPDGTPTSEMQRLIAHDPRNRDRVFPYLGGEDVNASPTHEPRRYVINFAQMAEAEARRWPDLFALVETKVKPERLKQNREIRKKYWWRFAEPSPALYSAVSRLGRVLVCCQTSKYRTFTFVPSGMVYDQKLVVIASDQFDAFAVLHSRIHEVWALFFGSTLEDRPVYTPRDCFETFPIPHRPNATRALQDAGRAYYEFRASLMAKNNEGLTDTYNRFHDPEERSLEVLELRRLHDEMDRAVLAAYGWSDLRPNCTFLLDYEEDGSEDDNGRARKKRKPWRYRWLDDVRDEILARLLALNAERAADEKTLGDEGTASPPVKNPIAAKRTKAAKRDAGPKLPGVE